MIASPGDVSEERDIAVQALYEWNDTDAGERNVVLLPRTWEKHATSKIAERAQSHINETVLAGCDLLVGIFWTRLGTPTGKAQSGSVEEIQSHVSSGKPALVFFSNKPVAPEILDPDQWRRLQEFRNWCRSKAVLFEYANVTEFEKDFKRQLRLAIYQDSYIKSVSSVEIESQDEVSVTTNDVSLNYEQALLLKFAANSKDAFVSFHRFMSGWEVSSGSETLSRNGSNRDEAIWRDAISGLEQLGLVDERSIDSGLYFLTSAGFEAADQIPNSIVEEYIDKKTN